MLAIRRLVAWPLISLIVLILWLPLRGSSPLEVRLENGSLQVSYASNNDFYYVLEAAESLQAGFQPQMMQLGISGSRDEFRVPLNETKSGYFRLRQVPMNAAQDQDGDGLPDAYELLRAPLLDPLLSEDGAEDFDMDGVSNAAEFLQGRSFLRSELAERFSMRGAHGIYINEAGAMQGWGWNGAIELGFDDREHRVEAVPMLPDQTWSVVSAGGLSTLALDSEGALWGWGQASGSPTLPILYDARRWRTVSADNDFGLALLEDGSLWSWKFTNNVRLQGGLIQLGEDRDWEQVVVSAGFGAALKGDGSLWVIGGLGDVIYGPFRRLGTDNDWVSVSANYNLALAVKRDGSLWAFGELGISVIKDRNAISKLPFRIGNESDWVSASANVGHVMALKEDGTIWGLGSNKFGQLARPLSFEQSYTPVQIGSDADWVAVEASNRESAALKRDGSVWLWGTQLGDGTTEANTTPRLLYSLEQN